MSTLRHRYSGARSLDPRRDYIDQYPRESDPLRTGRDVTITSGPGVQPDTVNTPDRSMLMTPDVFRAWRVKPDARPIVYQHEQQIVLVTPDASVNAVPITNTPFQADGFVINVPSAATQSVFYGPQGVNAQTGHEIRPGFPQFFGTDNVREIWELQTAIEDLGGLLATFLAAMTGQGRVDAPPAYMSPRVVFNMNERYLFAAATTTVVITLYLVPELQ